MRKLLDFIGLLIMNILIPVTGCLLVYWLFNEVCDRDNHYNVGYIVLMVPIIPIIAGWTLYRLWAFIVDFLKLIKE